MKRKTDPNALNDEEIAFLKSTKAPAVLREFVSRQHETVGTRTEAYRKVAAAARAEREALMEVAALQVLRHKIGIENPGPAQAEALEAECKRLTSELENVRFRLDAAVAGPALAVFGDGTGR